MALPSWIERLRRAPAQDYLIASLGAENDAPQHTEVQVDTQYITVVVKSARIVDIRRWRSKFYGCIHSRAAWLDEQRGQVESQAVLAPSMLKELDPANLDRVVQIDRIVLGPVPYRGRLDLEIGLFSVKSADLAAPYIDLLVTLADNAALPYLAAAAPFIDPLRKGVDLLFGDQSKSDLEIGYDRQFKDLTAGLYLAMRAPKDEAGLLKSLRLDPNDFRLLASGQSFGRYPYFVFEIQASTQRVDWMRIPDLGSSWEKMRKAFVEGQQNEAEHLIKEFERLCRASPDLVPGDALSLAKRARARFGASEGASTIAKGAAGDPGPFESLRLYANP